ncbi:MAG TPA: ABC transporter substrate-binding protein [Casimicrobiaceae bacterium]|nr:ABC transporter substrate-binding protein [Casimicrobiaceae bacterium]
MDRRAFVALTGSALLGLSSNLRAQGQVTARRIGFLSTFPRADIEAFLAQVRQELEKFGWTDGRNIVLLEPRTTGGDNSRLPSLASELVAQGPDLILVSTVPATRALMQATKSIPVVMVGVANPVELGIVAGFVKPGGNVTGSSFLGIEFAGKLLQVLKEAAPRLRSVALFVNPSNETVPTFVKQLRADAVALGMQAQVVEVSSPGDFEPAFVAIRRANTESILLPPEPLIQSKRDAIADFAQTHELPLAVVGGSRVLPASGLIAFGPMRDEYARLAARYIDQILKGAKPGDLSIEQPTRFHLVINLKTAKALGLTIPQSLLLRADEVIR